MTPAGTVLLAMAVTAVVILLAGPADAGLPGWLAGLAGGVHPA